MPTFALTHESIPPDAAAARPRRAKLAVWSGDYYALEVMQRLGLPDGAVRVGLVHYNTEQEVDRLLDALAERVRLLVLGGTAFLGRAIVEAALARGHEVTLFNRGRTNPELFPEVEKLRGDRNEDVSRARGREWDAVIDVATFLPRACARRPRRYATASHATSSSRASPRTPT